jgi:Flp pilus assembly protein TadB
MSSILPMTLFFTILISLAIILLVVLLFIVLTKTIILLDLKIKNEKQYKKL